MGDDSAADRPKRVLVADDDEDVCALLRVVLAPLAQVTTVNDAESALELIGTQPPYDAVVSDYMLPGCSGLELVERIRGGAHADTPILMISGHGGIVGERAHEAGANAFLSKPFTLAQIRAAVGGLLRSQIRFA